MRLVIISLDAVFSADADFLLSLPNLGRLAQEGVFCSQVQTIYPSLTYPIHTSLMTGCYPDTHGIDHNEPFQPDKKPSQRSWYWDDQMIRADTLFSRAKKAGRECAAILWPVTGHSKHVKFNFPEVLALPGENQTLKVLAYGSTAWLLLNELRFGNQRKSTKQPFLDDFAVLITEKLIQRHYVPGRKLGHKEDIIPSKRKQAQHMPDLLALHLTDCDTMRHQFGVFSEEARQALERLDLRVGRVMDELKKRGLLEDTIIAVVSDHGQADITGSLPLDSWLQANKVPARAQTLGLGAYIRIRRADYLPVLETLTEHQQQLHLQHIYTREELRSLHAAEDVYLAVEPEEGIVIVDEENQVKTGATHGFGPRHIGSRTLLWLRGPQFLKGLVLEECSLVDIAPTLAAAAGLTLPQAQGRVLQETFLWHHDTGRGEYS